MKTTCIRGHVIADVGRYAKGDCKACVRERNARCSAEKKRAWRAANPEHYRAYARKYERRRAGVVDATDETRAGPCANRGCNYAGELHLDHDHETGLVRGWLCGSCNRALGLLKDNAQTIQGLANYLKK